MINKNKIISAEILETKDGSVSIKVTIQREDLENIFDSYDFKKAVEGMIVQRLVDNISAERLNEIFRKIDLNVVAKLTTVELANNLAKKNY